MGPGGCRSFEPGILPHNLYEQIVMFRKKPGNVGDL
jgi:hypothetical protein